METGKVEDTLKERGAIYGDYMGGVKFRGQMMMLIKDRHTAVTGKPFTVVEEQCLFDIMMKISRLAVTPDHVDSWHDLAGYATLSEGVFNDSK